MFESLLCQTFVIISRLDIGLDLLESSLLIFHVRIQGSQFTGKCVNIVQFGFRVGNRILSFALYTKRSRKESEKQAGNEHTI